MKNWQIKKQVDIINEQTYLLQDTAFESKEIKLNTERMIQQRCMKIRNILREIEMIAERDS